jgi:hypothetical protein
MADKSCKWGTVSTIKADARDILNFAAFHIEQGAHRLYIYLDADCPGAFDLLKSHPKVRVQLRDAAFWERKGGLPEKHENRQTLNATHAYNRRVEVDWLAHIDVDEFMWSGTTPLASHLSQLSPDVLCARVRPIESLAGNGHAFKGYMPADGSRDKRLKRLYPRFGRHMTGGFLSHVQGKLLVRTGLDDMNIKIHNVYQGSIENPGHTELDAVDLCHVHARDWDDWLQNYRYRLMRGAYAADMAPNRDRAQGGVSKHELLTMIEEAEGEDGLRAFYDELCADTPEFRARLDAEGLLRIRDLNLDTLRRKHFPDF